jgi:basic amino acid/polyamine antiporter, APA family
VAKDSAMNDSHPQALPRVLRAFDAVAIVVGSIIGSGIFMKVGRLDHFGLEIGVWIFVGLVTLCGSLSLAELAAMLPQAGGPYVYLRAAYGRLAAFLWAWAEFWIIRTGSLGALSCATAIYLNEVHEIGRGGQQICAVSIVVVLTLVNAIGVRWGARVQNVTTIIKGAFLLALIVLPALFGKTNTDNLQPVWPEQIDLPMWRAIGLAVIAVMWPYDGWINIAPVAEEIEKPERNVPRALIIGMLIVIGLYVGAVCSYHLTLSMKEVADSNAIASDVCKILFGPNGQIFAAICVACSTFGACNSNILCGPRIIFAAARDGLLPGAIGRIQPTFRTPANAIIVQGIWAVILILLAFAWKSGHNDRPKDAFDALTDFVIFGGSVFYAMAVGAVFVLRRTMPNAHRPYHTWGYPITPALYLLAFAAVLVSLLVDKWQQTLAGSVLILAGAIVYFLVTRRERKLVMKDKP